MSRTFSNHWLNEEAREYLDKLGAVEIARSEEVDYWYGTGHQFITYRLNNGMILKEVEQACPWASGPNLFVCLQDERGQNVFEWSDEEINNV